MSRTAVHPYQRVIENSRREGERRVWEGARTATGAPRLRVGATDKDARRVVWEAHHNSTVAPGVAMVSTCGNDLCVAPGHVDIPYDEAEALIKHMSLYYADFQIVADLDCVLEATADEAVR